MDMRGQFFRGGPWGGTGIPVLELIIAGGAIFLVLIVLVLVVAMVVARSRRRERLMAEALRAGQGDLALYIVQGPRRFFTGLLLLTALFFLGVGLLDRREELALASGVVAALCFFVLIKRPRVRIGHQPFPPPPPGSSHPAGAVPQPPPPPPDASHPADALPQPPPPSPGPATPPAIAPSARASNGIFETALAIAMAILVVFAGLIMLRSLPELVLIVGIGVLVYLMAGSQRRAKCLRYLGRQAGRLRDWLEGKARED